MKRFFSIIIISISCFAPISIFSQSSEIKGDVWIPDLKNGKYKNPIICADYSDPDVIRVGDDFYLTSSSFSHFPGLPILHSRDLVNWEIIGHAIQNYPYLEFDKPQHGNGVWAPSMRYHNGEFYIYFGDPDRGVFMTKAKNPAGPWETLIQVKKALGWEDCCPLWDDDGKAYLVHAFVNSRCGIKHKLSISPMSADGKTIIGNDSLIFDGTVKQPVIEGPKFYKRNGYYYIMAPAGGVKPGWQAVLRAKNVYGPYEDRITLKQGTTKINGPHQGGWVNTPSGEDWFIHFQDRYAYGRIVHLEPMKWINDWPVMGEDLNHNGVGEPVLEFIKPNVGKVFSVANPQTSDEFNTDQLGLQWQWESNFKDSWFSLSSRKGYLRLYSEELSDDKNLWSIGRLLLQKMPAPTFSTTVKIEFSNDGDVKAGLLVFGQNYGYIALKKDKEGNHISQVICLKANQGGKEQTISTISFPQNIIYLKVNVYPENESTIIPKVLCDFSYSSDGISFQKLGETFTAREGQWVGAKVGLFCIGKTSATDFVDIDWMRFNK